MEPIQLKLVFVGDGAVGKTCCLIAFCKDEFPEDYVPTVFGNYESSIDRDGKIVRATLWDTAGQEDFDRLRKLSYPDTDVFMICYSVANRTSLNNVEEKWIPELDEYCTKAKRLLVGMKVDIRDDKKTIQELKEMSEDLVHYSEGEKVAKENDMRYIECSALKRTNLKEVFDLAVDLCITSSSGIRIASGENAKKCCVIL